MRTRKLCREKGAGLVCMAKPYPERVGYYDRKEIFRLCSCLGFPGSFLLEGLGHGSMPRFQSAERMSESVIKDLLNSKHFTARLEKTFNRYPAHYNRKLFLKAMLLLKQKQMSFSEISLARVSFELYCSEHGIGMLASANVVLQALSMLGRVMSPLKLEVEIQKQQAVVDFPSLIYLYEFMDLILKCALSSQVEEEMQSSESTE